MQQEQEPGIPLLTTNEGLGIPLAAGNYTSTLALATTTGANPLLPEEGTLWNYPT